MIQHETNSITAQRDVSANFLAQLTINRSLQDFGTSNDINSRSSSPEDARTSGATLVPPSQTFQENAIISSVTLNQRKGRKMSRRCGQRGSVEKKGNWWHVRYWVDTSEGRTHASYPICPAVGQKKKTKSEARRLAADWLTEQGINTEEHLARAMGPVVTFREQSEVWLHKLRTRNRNPIPDSSVPSIRSALDCWLLPNLGEIPLSDVNNTALAGLVKNMKDHLSPKTIDTYINIAKEIVGSLVNQDGEPVYARKWNNDVIDLPLVNKREQRRPKVAKEGVTAVIGSCETAWERILYTLCPAGGMRIAEVLRWTSLSTFHPTAGRFMSEDK